MYCAISGAVPEEPVVSTKSGHIFEKRLIEKALDATGGLCPETGQKLSKDDLIVVKSTGDAVRPVPPSAASMPGILQHLQNEWDAVTLENHRVKMVLNETRQELAHALYQYDAATRVIARLVKEKEAAESQARLKSNPEKALAAPDPKEVRPSEQIAEAQANGAQRGGGDSADVEMKPPDVVDAKLPAELLEQAVTKSVELQTKRKSRVLPETLASQSQVGQFAELSALSLDDSNVALTCVEITSDGIAFVGSSTGKICSVNAEDVREVGLGCKAHSDAKGGITKLSWSSEFPDRVISSGGDGIVKVWTKGDDWEEKESFSEEGAVVDLEVHPIQTMLFCCYENGMWLWRDIKQGATVSRNANACGEGRIYRSAAVHPDGMIFATGRDDGIVQMWDVKSMKCVAELGEKSSGSGGVVSIEMSDKGYYMASSVDGRVSMWDLRKQKVSGEVVVDGMKGRVAVSLDSTGEFGCGVGASNVTLFPAKRKAQTLVKFAVGDTALREGDWHRLGSAWGKDAQFVLAGGCDGMLRKYGRQSDS